MEGNCNTAHYNLNSHYVKDFKVDMPTAVPWVCSVSCKSMECFSMIKAEWCKQRSVTTHHAVCKRSWIDEYADLDQGEQYHLQEFMAKKGASLKHQYHKLSEAEKIGFMKEINVVREQHLKNLLSKSKAVQHDVTAAFDSMEQEVSRHILYLHAKNWWDTWIVDWNHIMHRHWRLLYSCEGKHRGL